MIASQRRDTWTVRATTRLRNHVAAVGSNCTVRLTSLNMAGMELQLFGIGISTIYA